jgi:hypothetical protein
MSARRWRAPSAPGSEKRFASPSSHQEIAEKKPQPGYCSQTWRTRADLRCPTGRLHLQVMSPGDHIRSVSQRCEFRVVDPHSSHILPGSRVVDLLEKPAVAVRIIERGVRR